tara:strand:- start:6326 stop:6550 length:225 start_codon:yes stop_codon:yes gene_type:complete
MMMLEPRLAYDDCIVGVVRRCGQEEAFCYDAQKVVGVLEGMGMEEEEAWEFFDFNVQGAYAGAGSPFFLYAVDV